MGGVVGSGVPIDDPRVVGTDEPSSLGRNGLVVDGDASLECESADVVARDVDDERRGPRPGNFTEFAPGMDQRDTGIACLVEQTPQHATWYLGQIDE